MSKDCQLQLKLSCILNVPLNNYLDCFKFIVNGCEFTANRLISDLLSPNICRIHINDPTFSTFIINTQYSGDFSTILNLINFTQIKIPDEELPFILEVIEILGTEHFYLNNANESTEITVNNVFSLLKKHEKYDKLYSKQILEEIDFISSHFNELCENQEEEFNQLEICTLYRIIKNDKIQLNDEDQLLKFVNQLYRLDSKYSTFYECINFLNVSSELMSEFVQIYNLNDINESIWLRLCERLQEIKNKVNSNSKQYTQKNSEERTTFLKKSNSEFQGIIKYLREKSNENIENEISFFSSSFLVIF